jgi:hypothetical protein
MNIKIFQSSDEDHGFVHLSSGDNSRSNNSRFNAEDKRPQKGGGGGGGATMIFRVRPKAVFCALEAFIYVTSQSSSF